MSLTATSRSKSTGKPVRWKRIGVMDVGSNSVRLVVYDVRGRAMQPRFNEKVLAGLGRGLNATGRLHKEGIEIAIAALARFASITRAQKVEALFPFATAAVREAADGKEFVDRVKKETGVTLRVLSGADEARFAAEGVLAGTPGIDGIAGDLGGSSLELARLAIDLDQSEGLGVSRHPLEVVEQRPVQVPTNVDTVGDGGGKPFERATCVLESRCVVLGRHPVLGDDHRQPISGTGLRRNPDVRHAFATVSAVQCSTQSPSFM